MKVLSPWVTGRVWGFGDWIVHLFASSLYTLAILLVPINHWLHESPAPCPILYQGLVWVCWL